MGINIGAKLGVCLWGPIIFTCHEFDL